MARRKSQVARARTEPVQISAYNPAWPGLFEQEARHLRACLPQDAIGRIAHFGSTAVPGLAAKPIIDMLIEVPSLRVVHETIAPILERQGYEYFWRPSWRDGVSPAYTWFIKRDGLGQRTHHLHMLRPDSPDWDRLLFRDYLIAHPSRAQAYGALKTRLAAKADDRVAYARAKSDFIDEVMRDARAGAGPDPSSA